MVGYMDSNAQDLMKLIQSRFQRMSKGQKLIAEYILKHYDKAAFMTAARFGKTVGVSESTVVRFANELGYSGYPQLQAALQEMIKTKLTSVQRIELSEDQINEKNTVKAVLKADIDNIRATMEKINPSVFEDSVRAMIKAKRIYIVGFRSSQALAEFMAFYLSLLLNDVRLVSVGMNDVYEQLVSVDKDDLVIGMGFPRYSTRTVEALAYAKDHGASVVALTDSMLSPLAVHADYCLIAQSNMASFADSLVAPLSVINALIVAASLKKKDTISDTFNNLEGLWSKHNVYTQKNKE
jgi:DNA-binding MurR/RpiR family transcriptional regulator